MQLEPVVYTRSGCLLVSLLNRVQMTFGSLPLPLRSLVIRAHSGRLTSGSYITTNCHSGHCQGVRGLGECFLRWLIGKIFSASAESFAAGNTTHESEMLNQGVCVQSLEFLGAQ